MKTVVVSGAFDDLRSQHVRFLEEASKLGAVHVLLWSDEMVAALTGKRPKFPLAERHYLLQAIRYVKGVGYTAKVSGARSLSLSKRHPSTSSGGVIHRQFCAIPKGVGQIDSLPYNPDALPSIAGLQPDIWAVAEADDNDGKRTFCAAYGIACRVFSAADLGGFPEPQDAAEPQGPSSIVHRPSVIVTGCYDWLHSGHVRFFEEVAELGDLYVAVGNDANVRHLKGAGHPLQCQDERRYMAGAIRYVTQALITSGHGWMDAEPEIERLKPDMYAVNEDGDVPEKRVFCQAHGLAYVVLKRTPKDGLAKRSSTDLRGF